MTLSEDYTRRFSGLGRLFGREALPRLAGAHVCIVGVGGVGSWCVEGLARSGLGALTLVDLDDICVTNTNRQLPALEGSFGRAKVEALAERARAIQPTCTVHARQEFFTERTAPELLGTRFDFVIDAIDKLSNKCLLIATAHRQGVPVITVGAAGGKRDGTAVRVADLCFSEKDNLLKFVRRKLRQDYGFPRQNNAPFGVTAVYSPEEAVYPWGDGTVCGQKEPASALALDCASGFGTASFVTAAFGFAAAGEVVRRISLGT